MSGSASSSATYDDDREYDARGSSSGEQLDLQHYLRILRKHKWPITLFTAAVTALAAYYAYTATPIYRASATLLIEQQQLNVPTIEEIYGLEAENTDYYQTQFELLKSRNLAQKVVERLDLWDDPELSPAARTAEAQADAAQRTVVDDEPTGIVGRIEAFLADIGILDDGSRIAAADPVGLPPGSETPVDNEVTLDLGGPEPVLVDPTASPDEAFSEDNLPPGVSPEEAAFAALQSVDFASNEPLLDPAQEVVVGNFMNRLTISPVRKTKLVNIGYESADPVKAARISNTIGDQYIKSYLDAKLEMTTMASDWLQGQLTKLKADLDEAEGRLVQYQTDNNLIQLNDNVAALDTQQILQLTSDLTQARAELNRAESVSREVQRLQGQPELLESIPAVALDPLVQKAKIDQGSVQRELDELLNRYGERHPSVVDKQSELNSINATLQGHLRRVSASLQQDVELARARVSQIEAQRGESRSNITDIGGKSFGLEALQREVETKRDIYTQFFNRLTEARSAEGLETANARVSDYARPPVSPVKPKKQLIIALAALASLVLSMLMAFLYETMDDTIKSTNDIEGKLGLKLLGILPLIKPGMLRKAKELPLNPEDIPDKKGTFAEAVSTARTALCLDDGAEGRQIVVVTSSIPGEGKSTASINLAYSLGQLERVLLIDCDMRRPTIAKAAELDRDTVGLSNLISGTASARDCIRRGPVERVGRRPALGTHPRTAARAAVVEALREDPGEPAPALRSYRHRQRAHAGGVRCPGAQPLCGRRGVRRQVPRHLHRAGASRYPAAAPGAGQHRRRAHHAGGHRQDHLVRRRLLLPGLLRLLRLQRERRTRAQGRQDPAHAGGAAGDQDRRSRRRAGLRRRAVASRRRRGTSRWRVASHRGRLSGRRSGLRAGARRRIAAGARRP